MRHDCRYVAFDILIADSGRSGAFSYNVATVVFLTEFGKFIFSGTFTSLANLVFFTSRKLYVLSFNFYPIDLCPALKRVSTGYFWLAEYLAWNNRSVIIIRNDLAKIDLKTKDDRKEKKTFIRRVTYDFCLFLVSN